MHSQFEDVSAYLMEKGEIKLQFLIGNEAALERRQVLRKASYQGGAYRAQLESVRPVYTNICAAGGIAIFGNAAFTLFMKHKKIIKT